MVESRTETWGLNAGDGDETVEVEGCTQDDTMIEMTTFVFLPFRPLSLTAWENRHDRMPQL